MNESDEKSTENKKGGCEASNESCACTNKLIDF